MSNAHKTLIGLVQQKVLVFLEREILLSEVEQKIRISNLWEILIVQVCFHPIPGQKVEIMNFFAEQKWKKKIA